MSAAPRLGGDWLPHRHNQPDRHVSPVPLIDHLPTSRLAQAVERRRLEDAFMTLNPDFGVTPEHDHHAQHRLAYDREQAITLGLRHLVDLRNENTGPAHRRRNAIRQRSDDAQCRAIHRTTDCPDPPARLPAREGLER